ncbi:MAG: hypothetical protein RIR39_644, partial [Pseudomonadota bacterium]
EMLFRYRARNYSETLNNEEQIRWNQFCQNRLAGHQAGASITLDAYLARLDELRNSNNCNVEIINALDAYAHDLCKV